jgi:hypothetical protein
MEERRDVREGVFCDEEDAGISNEEWLAICFIVWFSSSQPSSSPLPCLCFRKQMSISASFFFLFPSN